MAIGSGVLGGTISATVLGILFVPLFFVVVTRLSRGGRDAPDPTAKGDDPSEKTVSE
jgi:HAE1 family hydrophobic/amphiphilic exporter-1/multidrug efflux pump